MSKEQISDKILEIASLWNDETYSDLSGLADMLASDILGSL